MTQILMNHKTKEKYCNITKLAVNITIKATKWWNKDALSVYQ